jgi:hypothetical protein
VKRLATLLAVFALLVAGIESLRLIVAWWQAGRPPPGWEEILAFFVLAAVAVVWWRYSVFGCGSSACLRPEPPPASGRPPDK